MSVFELPVRPPVAPMLATLAHELPAAGRWYEPKWDGFRCIAFRDRSQTLMTSRNQRPLQRYFPEIAEALTALRVDRLVIDGEIVAMGENGLDFASLMLRLHPVASRVAQLRTETPAQHPYLGTAEALDTPQFIVFDLDPGAPATYGETKAFARAVARVLEQQHPDLVVSAMAKTRRVGKVFIDWSQNDKGKSTIVPYSVRGLPLPTVSTPVNWDEVTGAIASGDPRRMTFLADDALRRARSVDLFAPVLTTRQRLPMDRNDWSGAQLSRASD